MPTSRMVCLSLLGLWLTVAGCRSSTPVSPSSPLDGTWTGTITHSAAGAGHVVLRMRQTGASVSGTWSADYPGTTFDATGTVGGTLIGTAVSLFLTPEAPLVCGPGASLSGTLALEAALAGSRLTGTFVVFVCDDVDSGQVEVTRSS